MAKGYWVGHVDIHDADGYRPYVEANAAIFRKYGGRFLARRGNSELVEGSLRRHHVLIEFPDYASALACYRSPEYQQNITVRKPHSIIDLAVVEGYDGPQP